MFFFPWILRGYLLCFNIKYDIECFEIEFCVMIRQQFSVSIRNGAEYRPMSF